MGSVPKTGLIRMTPESEAVLGMNAEQIGKLTIGQLSDLFFSKGITPIVTAREMKPGGVTFDIGRSEESKTA